MFGIGLFAFAVILHLPTQMINQPKTLTHLILTLLPLTVSTICTMLMHDWSVMVGWQGGSYTCVGAMYHRVSWEAVQVPLK